MHTFAVLQGEEDYNHMSEGLAPILDEINDVIENNNVVLNGQNLKLKFFWVWITRYTTKYYSCNTLLIYNTLLTIVFIAHDGNERSSC